MFAIPHRSGVRFYFRYEELITHPKATFDGVLPVKVKDEIVLSEWVYKIIVPTERRLHIEPHIPDLLKDRVVYVENDCRDIWDWSEKVYRMICFKKEI